MQVHDKTTVTFDALENSCLFGDDQLEAVEEHILRTYDPPLASAIIEGLYNSGAAIQTEITTPSSAAPNRIPSQDQARR